MICTVKTLKTMSLKRWSEDLGQDWFGIISTNYAPHLNLYLTRDVKCSSVDIKII